MDYSGFTWMFKSPGAKITVEDVRQTLIDLGSQRVRGWDLVVKQYSNQAELAGPMNVKSMARVYTIRDSALPTSIAILMHKSKRVHSLLIPDHFRLPQADRFSSENSRPEAHRIGGGARFNLHSRRHTFLVRSDNEEQFAYQRNIPQSRNEKSSKHDVL